MTRVVWSNKVGGLPRVDNARSVPKKPVIWRGEVWLRMPNGERCSRSWKSHNKIMRQQAQEVMQIMLADLIEECGQDAAVDSGFTNAADARYMIERMQHQLRKAWEIDQ